jgi:hypothetical protein
MWPMTLLAEAKVQGSHLWWPGLRPETDDRLEQNLAYYLPAHHHLLSLSFWEGD